MQKGSAVKICCFSIMLTAIAPVAEVRSQPTACFPPIPPIATVNERLVAEYREFLEAEYERYFKEVEDYFRCASEQWQLVFDEAKAASEDLNKIRQR